MLLQFIRITERKKLVKKNSSWKNPDHNESSTLIELDPIGFRMDHTSKLSPPDVKMMQESRQRRNFSTNSFRQIRDGKKATRWRPIPPADDLEANRQFYDSSVSRCWHLWEWKREKEKEKEEA